jgi:hypothetical protein
VMDLDGASRLLILLAAVNVTCTAILVLSALQHRDWPALTDRAFVGVLLAVIAVAAGLLGLNRLGLFPLQPGVAVSVLVIGMMLVSLPSIVWVAQLFLNVFRAAEAKDVAQVDTLARIEAGVERAVERADAAYTEANTVNQKIDARTKAIAKGEEVERTT